MARRDALERFGDLEADTATQADSLESGTLPTPTETDPAAGAAAPSGIFARSRFARASVDRAYKSVRGLVPALEALADVSEEASGEGAVDEAMVVGEGDVHDRANRDHVLPHLVLDDPGRLHDRVGARIAACGWLMTGVPWNVPSRRGS